MNMIKKWTINKIVVASVSLLLLFMFYLIPAKPNIETEGSRSVLPEIN